MLSDEEVQSNSYAGRTEGSVAERSKSIGDDCNDEINLSNEEEKKKEEETSHKKSEDSTANINSIEDHEQYKANTQENHHYAQISPEPIETNFRVQMGVHQKLGQGIDAYITYKLVTEVNGVPGYQKQKYETWRRFSDFLALHDKISEKYRKKGFILPQKPEKSLADLTKVKSASDDICDQVAIRRIRLLQRFINRLCEIPRIRTDCDVRDFLTYEPDLPTVETATTIKNGVLSLFKNVQSVFSKLAMNYVEGDRWFETTQSQIDELDVALGRLCAGSEALVASRKEMVVCGEQFSHALSDVAVCEESSSLSRAISSLTDLFEHATTIWKKQADTDTVVFCESIQEYVHLISSLKAAFQERIRAWQEWQEAIQLLSKKREQKSKMDFSGQVQKSNQLKTEIDETIVRIDELEVEFGEISKTIRGEVARFEESRKKDMKKMLLEYMQKMIDSQKEILKLWEKFEPQVHNIQV